MSDVLPTAAPAFDLAAAIERALPELLAYHAARVRETGEPVTLYLADGRRILLVPEPWSDEAQALWSAKKILQPHVQW